MVKHSSRILLSQSTLKANFTFLRKVIGKDVRISSVVKANAYGHGTAEFVPMAEKCGIDHFAVSSSYEAEEVLAVCHVKSKIMIMGILYDEDIPWALKHNIEIYVYNYNRLKLILEEAEKLDTKAHLHLEIETGANRTGMTVKELRKGLTLIKKKPHLATFEGLCTHFGGAETFANKFKVTKQHEKFKECYKICKQRNILPRYRHLASSAAALAYPETRYEMVRIGVAQYGFWPSPDVYYFLFHEFGNLKNGLKRIFTWKTEVMDIRHVNEGEFVGYGTVFQAVSDMKIAVLPLGYSNGYPRGLSNRGQVLIGGRKARVVGLINMNLFMVDVSHIPNVKVGDEVVLIGRQGNSTISVSSFTNITHHLNQEMMSRLPPAIPRIPVR